MNRDKTLITSIAIGGFDGMHIAHQTLFSNLSKHGAIVSIESGYANLTPKNIREKYTTFPIFYYELEKIKHLEGKDFIKLLQKEFPNLRKIIVGFDFCFGKDRAYCINELKNIFKGEIVIVNEVSINNIAIHSRIIREYIKKGDFITANTLLGRKYQINGKQIKGQGLGKTEFVPTINLEITDYLLPNEGVFITKTVVDNISYPSITFIGHRVTTDGSFAVETHILDKDIKKHNENIGIKFYKKVRDNQKFNSFEELKKQILNDINECKDFFSLS